MVMATTFDPMYMKTIVSVLCYMVAFSISYYLNNGCNTNTIHMTTAVSERLA